MSIKFQRDVVICKQNEPHRLGFEPSECGCLFEKQLDCIGLFENDLDDWLLVCAKIKWKFESLPVESEPSESYLYSLRDVDGRVVQTIQSKGALACQQPKKPDCFEIESLRWMLVEKAIKIDHWIDILKKKEIVCNESCFDV